MKSQKTHICNKLSKNIVKKYECTKCGYISEKTILVIFEGKEHRFCAKCWLRFMGDTIPSAILLPEG
jgi:hypothetical protein